MVVAFARHACGDKLVVNWVSDRAALRQHENVLWPAALICNQASDRARDACNLLSECIKLNYYHFAGAVLWNRRKLALVPVSVVADKAFAIDTTLSGQRRQRKISWSVVPG